MTEVINVFKEQVPDLIADFKTGLENNDFEQLKRIAHKSKNAMSVMGVQVMVDNLCEFENADLAHLPLKDISAFILNFENVCHQTINELDLVLQNINAHT